MRLAIAILLTAWTASGATYLLNVTPCPSAKHLTDRRTAYAKHSPNLNLCDLIFSKPTNAFNIWLGEFVPPMGFTKRESVFTKHVCAIVWSGSKKQMCRVNTGRAVAFVKNAQPLWNGSKCHFQRMTMRQNSMGSSMGFKLSIPLWVSVANPEPAPA